MRMAGVSDMYRYVMCWTTTVAATRTRQVPDQAGLSLIARVTDMYPYATCMDNNRGRYFQELVALNRPMPCFPALALLVMPCFPALALPVMPVSWKGRLQQCKRY